MIKNDYVIILNKKKKFKKNKINKFKEFIIVNNKKDLYEDNSQWFINFINNKIDKTIYFNCNNLDFKINCNNEIIDKKLWEQFLLDAKRCKFKINNKIFKDLNLLQKTVINHYKDDITKINLLAFLCSQTSLAFLIQSIHSSILNSKKNYIIAEVSEISKFKRKMLIDVDLNNNNVTIKKNLRLITLNKEDVFITINHLQLTLNFSIDENNSINSVITIDNL